METLNLSRQPDGSLIHALLADGFLQVWERPVANCRYLVSVRGGGAVRMVGGMREKERSVIMVLRHGYLVPESEMWVRHRLAARLAPEVMLDPTPLAEIVEMVARWYGRALCLVEVKDGAILARECQRLGANVQVREVLDKATGEFTKELGWLTDLNAGEAAYNALKNAIRESNEHGDGKQRRGALLMECAHCFAQLETFVPPGSDAPAISRDEDVWTLATGLYNLGSATKLREETRKRMGVPDRWKATEDLRFRMAL